MYELRFELHRYGVQKNPSIGYYVVKMSSSWNFPAQASPSCEGSEQSRAKLEHFNFRAETELTILTYTGYIEVFMQGKCGRDTETTFELKRRFGTHGNGKN